MSLFCGQRLRCKEKNIIQFGNFSPFSTTKIKPYIIVVPWLNTNVPKIFKIEFYLLLPIKREFSCLNRKQKHKKSDNNFSEKE